MLKNDIVEMANFVIKFAYIYFFIKLHTLVYFE